MKVITPRDTTNAMGPLGAGPLLWSKLMEEPEWAYARSRGDFSNPCRREWASQYADAFPWSARYYKAIDAITNMRRAVCKNQPCAMCDAYLEGSGVFP